MKKDYTIAVAGTGYVGLSIATLLSQHHKVMAIDIVKEKVDLINNRKSPIQDNYIEKYLAEKELNLTATLDAKEAYSNADFVVIAAPTNYDSATQHFDTSAVEAVIKLVMEYNYILFLACYLHDISMVKIPACDSFLLDTDKADELAKTLLDSYNEEFNKANLTKNVQGNDIDILSVKKYMLDSYRKIDNYFEEAVRSKHANDSAAEIRKRSELNYLDTSMRELVAEVSEAHGADERDIYGIKSVASKQLISIKFDKILLRLADLLDMSSYRVSKPILYHNVEQMSEESAFHWISHLLTKGYSLRTEYEITDNAHVLAPKNIIEKLVLEIPVNISQMSALTCGRTCKKVGIDRNRLSQQGIVLVCGQECKDNGNQERNCNFLCKWFCVKNENLIKELAALKEYLNRNKNNYFKSAIEIRIKCNDRTSLDARQFEILNEYIGKM